MIDCPNCGLDKHVIGVKVPGVYDGVLYWVCGACAWAWSRDWSDYARRQAVAEEYVRRHNNGQEHPPMEDAVLPATRRR